MPVQPVKNNPRRRGNSVPPCQRYTPADFQREYPDDDACLEYLLQKRWPGGLIHCFKCSKVLRHYKVSGRQSYACRACGNQVHPTAGTIFHKSTTPLTTWFYVMRLMASTRVGVSAKQIQREGGVTYKTAWRMMAQVRKLMAEQGIKLAGPVEIDDAVFGGSDTNKHQELRGGAKQAVVGIVARHSGKVVARVVESVSKAAAEAIVGEVLPPATTIYSDSHASYDGLQWMGKGHRHSTVNHSRGWVRVRSHADD